MRGGHEGLDMLVELRGVVDLFLVILSLQGCVEGGNDVAIDVIGPESSCCARFGTICWEEGRAYIELFQLYCVSQCS